MSVAEETVTFYNTINDALSSVQTQLVNSYPYVEATGESIHGAQAYKLFYCYYAPISK